MAVEDHNLCTGDESKAGELVSALPDAVDVDSMDLGGQVESYEGTHGYPEDSSKVSDRHPEPPAGRAEMVCIDFGPDGLTQTQVHDVAAFFEKPRPAFSKVRWINVIGPPSPGVLDVLAAKFYLHPLAVEDLIQTPQRPKLDEYNEFSDHSYLFVTTRAVDEHEGKLRSQQVSMFVGDKQLISFQEFDKPLWDSTRTRLEDAGSRLRRSGTDFLFYCLLDRIVDEVFPVMQDIGEELDHLDGILTAHIDKGAASQVYDLKRALLVMRREVWPMRDLMQSIRSSEHPVISPETRAYLRDVQDHCRHLADTIELYREATVGMLDVYTNSINQRMNDVMKVLTIIATIFIPLSFLTGVFGMNFTGSLPGQDDGSAFWIFVSVCLLLAGGMLGFFRYKKWL
jgi:magnesium transporter